MLQYDPRFARQLHQERVTELGHAHLDPSADDTHPGTAEQAGMARIRLQVQAGVRELRERGHSTLADDLQAWVEQTWGTIDVHSERAG